MTEHKSNNILNIPNILTYIRFLLIPVIVWIYIGREDYVLAAVLIAFSFFTDVADGYIARHFDMVTDLGKIIDPIADKLTQIAVIICLTTRYPLILSLLVLVAVKEVSIGIITLIAMKRTKKVQSAKWYGKLATGAFYLSTIIIILFKDIPEQIADIMILICCLTVLMSLVLYAISFFKLLKTAAEEEKAKVNQ